MDKEFDNFLKELAKHFYGWKIEESVNTPREIEDLVKQLKELVENMKR